MSMEGTPVDAMERDSSVEEVLGRLRETQEGLDLQVEGHLGPETLQMTRDLIARMKERCAPALEAIARGGDRFASWAEEKGIPPKYIKYALWTAAVGLPGGVALAPVALLYGNSLKKREEAGLETFPQPA